MQRMENQNVTVLWRPLHEASDGWFWWGNAGAEPYKWLWFSVWNWGYIVVDGTTELSEAYTSLDMMKKVYDSEVIITRDELPRFD